MAYSTTLTPAQALPKIRHYCAYQERCHQEVREKLYGYGLKRPEVEQILSQLIEEDYLNEERFAQQFAGGKFRMKGWGRNRIKMELKQRQVSEYCIRKAIKDIAAEAYEATCRRMAAARWETLNGEPSLMRQKKTRDFLIYKGYEPEIVQQIIQELLKGGEE